MCVCMYACMHVCMRACSMSSLKHSNGAPMLAIFGKHGSSDARDVQGGIINFEVR